MLELGLDLVVFLVKVAAIVFAIVFIIAFSIGQAAKGNSQKAKFQLKSLNKQQKESTDKLKKEMLSGKELKAYSKKEKKEAKKLSKHPESKAKVFVLDFNGDMKASAAEQLKESVTQILYLAEPSDEVLVRLESPGGMVSGYGLAASELSRFRSHNIPLTVSVDKVAASGGYLMSCVANKIVAAPFAVIGSIGVVAGMPNFHKLLKKHDIDYELLTAGKFKRTLTMLGENTEEGRKKFLDQLEQIHILFKDFVSDYRPQLDMEKVATGEYWFGKEALDLKLIDKIQTSEDLILELSKEKEVYHLDYKEKQKLIDKILESASSKLHKSPIDFI